MKKTADSPVVTGFKGFDKDLKCKGFQYEVGKTYTHDSAVKLCSTGFHFCENPWDTLSYYPIENGNRYAQTEAQGVTDEREKDSKRVSSVLAIKAELTLKSLIDCAVKFTLNLAKSTPTGKVESYSTGDYGHAVSTGYSGHAVSTGNYGHAVSTGNSGHAASTGYSGHAASTGYSGHAASTGYSGHAASTGNYGHAASTGYSGHAASTGNYGHAASTGNSGHAASTGYSGHAASTGYSGHAASTGNYGHAVSTGYSGHAVSTGESGHAASTGYYGHASAMGKGSIAAAIGIEGMAKAAKGNWIVLAEYTEDRTIRWVKTEKIDGKTLKADTFYMLKKGKFVEVAQ
jgi:hypothetical protein